MLKVNLDMAAINWSVSYVSWSFPISDKLLHALSLRLVAATQGFSAI